jgi:hypothetical protein
MVVLIGRILAAIAVAGVAAWCAAALHFGPAPSDLAAAAIAAAGLLAAAAVFAVRLRRVAWTLFAVAIAAFLVFWSTIDPSNDRDWAPEVSVLPSVVIDGDEVTIHNIRNLQYRTETDFTPRYYDKTFRLSELETADVLASYWMGDAIAHIFLSFGFAGRDYVSVSIETRKERTESYSTVAGFFRNYELYYVVADERDLIGVRTNYRNDPPEQVYLYRTRTPRENVRRVFLDYVASINSLVEHPQFYNTLTTNCTTTIFMHSRVNPDAPKLSWKVLASGYVPEFLYENGRLATSLPFEELKRRSLINDAARAAGIESPDFSKLIRANVPDPRTDDVRASGAQ